MKEVTFITGNQAKADYLAKYLEHPVEHVKLELDEIQSLDLKEIVEHKVRQAYEKIKKPILVEDVGLYCEALGGLPGSFIKFFVEGMPEVDFCALFDGKSRKATARCVSGMTALKSNCLRGTWTVRSLKSLPEKTDMVGIVYLFVKGLTCQGRLWMRNLMQKRTKS